MEEVSAGSTSAEPPRKALGLVSKAAPERSKLVDELSSLKTKLEESVTEKGVLKQTLESVREQVCFAVLF
jgi:hypothetical protein